VKVIVAPATGECVFVSRVPVNSQEAVQSSAGPSPKVRIVGVGDGDFTFIGVGVGVINPEQPELMVFDEQYKNYRILVVFLDYFHYSNTLINLLL
jgi:hypothetical protein